MGTQSTWARQTGTTAHMKTKRGKQNGPTTRHMQPRRRKLNGQMHCKTNGGGQGRQKQRSNGMAKQSKHKQAIKHDKHNQTIKHKRLCCASSATCHEWKGACSTTTRRRLLVLL